MTLVRYLSTPVQLFIELQEVLDGLQREVHLSSLDGGHTVRDEVVDGIVHQREALAAVRVSLYDQAIAARDAGEEVADLAAEYPDGSVDQVLAITTASREAGRAADEGRLLTPPVRDELRHFQEWVYEQVEAQLRGGPPSPYEPPGPRS